MSVPQFLLFCAFVFALFYICVRLWAERHPCQQPASIDKEQRDTRAVVAMMPQHSPGVSVGDWPDEYAVDPAYDALEAIRPSLGHG